MAQLAPNPNIQRRMSKAPSHGDNERISHSPLSHDDTGSMSMAMRRKSIFPGKGLLRGMKKAPKAATEEREKSGVAAPQQPLEPTYRMEPKAKFYAPSVHALLKQILDNHLDGFTYNQKFTPTMTKVLSDEIKERAKALNFERYKLVVSVVLGERKDQGLMVSSRASWDAKLDSYATYTFQNATVFCTASVYGVYAE